MKPLTQEWVAKAEADLRIARHAHAMADPPGHDAACFHAQQAAEKYLKALLQERVCPFPRTHDLPVRPPAQCSETIVRGKHWKHRS